MSLEYMATKLAFYTDRLSDVKVPTPAEADEAVARLKAELATAAAQWMRVYVSGAAKNGRDSYTCPPDWRWEGDAIAVWKEAAAVVAGEMRAAGWRHFYVDGCADRSVRLHWAR